MNLRMVARILGNLPFGDKMQQLKNRTKTHKNNAGKGIIDCAGQTQDKALALASDA